MILSPIGPALRTPLRVPVLGRRAASLDAQARALFPQALGGAMLSVDRPEYLYQANDTATPVTGYGQPVGRILDQSGKGTHFGQSTTTSRPMRQQDAGGFSYLQVRTDDFLQSLANVDYSAAAYVTTVVALRRRTTDSSLRALFELSPNINNNAGSLALFLSDGTNAGAFQGRSRGSITSVVATADVAATGAPALVTMVSSIANDVLTVSAGGSSVSQPSDQGTGGYQTYPAYLFARGGASNFADLDFYAMLQIPTAQPLTPQQLYLAQLWCASKMGVKP